jgi:hypothetical protein
MGTFKNMAIMAVHALQWKVLIGGAGGSKRHGRMATCPMDTSTYLEAINYIKSEYREMLSNG